MATEPEDATAQAPEEASSDDELEVGSASQDDDGVDVNADEDGDVVMDGPLLTVDMSEFVTAGIGTGSSTATREGTRRLVVELASGYFSRFGIDTGTLSADLFDAASDDPPPGAFDHTARMLGCLPLAAGMDWLPLCAATYRDDHVAYMAQLAALNSARDMQYGDKVRRLEWLTRPYVPQRSEDTTILQVVAEAGGLDARNVLDGRSVRLLGAPQLGGDVMAFAGLESRTAAPGASEFAFDDYLAALSSLSEGAPVGLVDNASQSERGPLPLEGVVSSVADGGATIHIRLSRQQQAPPDQAPPDQAPPDQAPAEGPIEVHPLSFSGVCLFPQGFPPVLKRDLAATYSRIRSRDTRVLDFAMPCTFAELLAWMGARSGRPVGSVTELLRLLGQTGLRVDQSAAAAMHAVPSLKAVAVEATERNPLPPSAMRLLGDRMLGLARENATIAAALKGADAPGAHAFVPPPDLEKPDAGPEAAALEGRPLLSPTQFVYFTGDETSVLVDFGYSVLPGSMDGSLGQPDAPVLVRGRREPLVCPPDTANTDASHAEQPHAHPDVAPSSLAFSLEYRRLTKYSGDISLGEGADVATFEDVSSNYNAGISDPGPGSAALTQTAVAAAQAGSSPAEATAAAFLAACGMSRDEAAAAAQKTARVLTFFTERTLHAKYNQLLKQRGASLQLMADAPAPSDFPYSADLFKKMVVALHGDAAVVREAQAVLQQLLPAVAKALIRLGELAVAEAPQKAQYSRVDDAFQRLYMGGVSPADLKSALAELNSNAAFMLKFDYAIKGLANTQSVYLRHLVEFPEAQYGIGTWHTYKPYFHITPKANGIGRYLLALQDQLSSRPALRTSSTGAPLPANGVLVSAVSDSELSHGYHDFMRRERPDALGQMLAAAGQSSAAIAPSASAPPSLRQGKPRGDAAAPAAPAAPEPVAAGVKGVPAESNAAAASYVAANKALLGVSSLKDVEPKVLDALYDSVAVSSALKDAASAADPALISFVRQRVNALLLAQGLGIRLAATSCLDAMPRAQACKLAFASLLRVLYMLSTKPNAARALQDGFEAEQVLQAMDVSALNSRFEQIRESFNQGIIAPLKTMDKEDRAIYRELLDMKVLDGDSLRRVAVGQDPGEEAPGSDTDMLPLHRDDDEHAESLAEHSSA